MRGYDEQTYVALGNIAVGGGASASNSPTHVNLTINVNLTLGQPAPDDAVGAALAEAVGCQHEEVTKGLAQAVRDAIAQAFGQGTVKAIN